MSESLSLTPNSGPLMLECGENMLLMNNLYNKASLTSNELKGAIFNGISVGNNILNVSNYMYIDGGVNFFNRHKFAGIYEDRFINNRYYYVVNNTRSNISPTQNYLVISEETSEDINILKTIASPLPTYSKYDDSGSYVPSHSEWMGFIDDTSEYLFAWYNYYSQNGATGTSLDYVGIMLVRINKTTLEVTNLAHYKCTVRPNFSLFYKNDSFFYGIITNCYNNNPQSTFSVHILIKINKSTFQVEATHIVPNSVRTARGNFNTDNSWSAPPNIRNHTWDDTNVWRRWTGYFIEDFYKYNNQYYYFLPQKGSGNENIGNADGNATLSNSANNLFSFTGSYHNWSFSANTAWAQYYRLKLNPSSTFSSIVTHEFLASPVVIYTHTEYRTNDNNKFSAILTKAQNYLFPYNNSNYYWTDSRYTIQRHWIIGNYLYVAIYNENAESNMLTHQGVCVLQILTDAKTAIHSNCRLETRLTHIGRTQFSNQKSIISMVYNSDKTILLVGYKNNFEIWKLITSTHLYANTGLAYSNIRCVGFDKLDRIWYQTLTNGVHYLSLNDPVKVTIKFEKQFYTYIGTDIESYVTFSAVDAFNTAAHGQYVLTLEGNAHFIDTNNKQLNITYNGDNTIHYPIMITGNKTIKCSAKYQKVWEV